MRALTNLDAPSPGHGQTERRFAIAAQAIRLFEERGLDATTVDDIAAAAGISPRTFFRYFATKEAAAFPDHEARIAELRRRLGARRSSPEPLAAACEVSQGLALEYFSAYGLYRPRYHLVKEVPALRDYERLMDREYEVALDEYLAGELTGDAATIVARLVAAAIVAGVNHTLEVWANQDEVDGAQLLERTFAQLRAAFPDDRSSAPASDGPAEDLIVVVPASSALRGAIVEAMRAARAD